MSGLIITTKTNRFTIEPGAFVRIKRDSDFEAAGKRGKVVNVTSRMVTVMFGKTKGATRLRFPIDAVKRAHVPHSRPNRTSSN